MPKLTLSQLERHLFAAADILRGKNVNGRKLANLLVPIAPPDEQHRIVAHLDELQAQVHAVQRLQAATAAKLEALLPSVLDQAFKGEL